MSVVSAVSVPILNVNSFRLGLRPRLGDATAAQRPGRALPKYLCLDSVDRYVLTSLALDFGRAQQQLPAHYRALAG